MSKSIFERNDYKGVTAASVYNMIKTLNETNETDKKDAILFMTSLGIIQAEEILPRDYFEDEVDEEKIFPDYILQIALNSRDEMLKEHDNEQLLSQQSSFVLKNVKIKQNGSAGTTNVPIMILFSEDITGISFGRIE